VARASLRRPGTVRDKVSRHDRGLADFSVPRGTPEKLLDVLHLNFECEAKRLSCLEILCALPGNPQLVLSRFLGAKFLKPATRQNHAARRCLPPGTSRFRAAWSASDTLERPALEQTHTARADGPGRAHSGDLPARTRCQSHRRLESPAMASLFAGCEARKAPFSVDEGIERPPPG